MSDERQFCDDARQRIDFVAAMRDARWSSIVTIEDICRRFKTDGGFREIRGMFGMS